MNKQIKLVAKERGVKDQAVFEMFDGKYTKIPTNMVNKIANRICEIAPRSIDFTGNNKRDTILAFEICLIHGGEQMKSSTFKNPLPPYLVEMFINAVRECDDAYRQAQEKSEGIIYDLKRQAGLITAGEVLCFECNAPTSHESGLCDQCR